MLKPLKKPLKPKLPLKRPEPIADAKAAEEAAKAEAAAKEARAIADAKAAEEAAKAEAAAKEAAEEEADQLAYLKSNVSSKASIEEWLNKIIKRHDIAPGRIDVASFVEQFEALVAPLSQAKTVAEFESIRDVLRPQEDSLFNKFEEQVKAHANTAEEAALEQFRAFIEAGEQTTQAAAPSATQSATDATAPAMSAADANKLLLTAARTSDVDGVSQALAAGADVNTKTAGGSTALILAASAKAPNVAIVQQLLAAGADLSARNNDKINAANAASKNKNSGASAVAKLIDDARAAKTKQQ